MELAEYSQFDATGLADLVRRGETTAGDLARCAIEGVTKVDDTLGSVVEAYADRAEALGFEFAPTGPFGGVPTLLKDLFHGESGSVCENGSRLTEGWVVPADSEFPLRIRRSGLVNLGRTTTSEFGILGTSETLAAGRTCSPWSAEHIAGGSSGGAAAAVGAGIVPVAAASDGGGSIRIPAAACGVVGLKPSRGRVTWGPHIAEALIGWAVHFMVSRTVRDTAGLLDALHGPLAGDPFHVAAPRRAFGQEVGAPVERLRVAYWSDPWSGADADPQVARATEATARLLEGLGHEVEHARPPVEWEPFLQAMTDVWAADNAHTIDGIAHVLGRTPSPDNLEGSTFATLEYGRTVSAGRLLDAKDVANHASRAMGWFFSTYDVLLTPTLGTLPAKLGTYDPTERLELHELFDRWSAMESFLPIFNATGQPAISLPLHTSEEGLPIGMQLVTRFGGESLLLRLSAQLEEALPWVQRRPPIHVAN
ncbi:MAG: amidase family protein [Actinomycetota bacterium]|nr:amidase family protein [Actinomycetota bacterium]MDH5277886.1 amidase family protein [Actinomycetota bacterium]